MHTLTALEIQKKFLDGEASAREIVDHFIQRIERHDGKIGAFLSILNERAREKAEILDKKRAKGEPLGKLAGIPIAVKDNIHVKGELTTCASKFLSNYRALFDATCVKRIEAEDGLIIGKTNLDEFAMGSSCEHSAYKLVKNPWNLNCTPGGSSGGSAAAVAARLAPLSLGSDTGGSIRQPAAYCGVAGFKPTYGRVSRYGLVAFGSSLDQIGPFGYSIPDIALLMEVIGRHCPNDSTSLPDPKEETIPLNEYDFQGKTIGVPWKFIEGLNQKSLDNFKAALNTFENLGVNVVEVDLNILKYAVSVYYILSSAEASTNLARFDGIRYGIRSEQAKTLDEVYDLSKEEGFGDEVKRRILLGTFVLSAGYQDAYYRKAQKVRTLMIEEFKRAYSKCDIVAAPVTSSTAFELGSIQDPIQMYLEDLYTIPCNLAGLPAISVPSGFSDNRMPFGIQFIGPQKADPRVLRYAHAFEKAQPDYYQIPELFRGANQP